MISVQVVRGAGDKAGTDIADSLLTTNEAARERGRVEIDSACSNRQSVTITGPLLQYIQPGALVAVLETEVEQYNAQVTGWDLRITRDGTSIEADQTVTVERVAR